MRHSLPSSRRRFLGSATAAGVGLVWSGREAARAEPLPPWTRSVTRDRPAFPLFDPLELIYRLSWNGVIEAGRTTITIGRAAPGAKGLWRGESTGRSNGLAGRLWPYRHHFRSLFHPDGLRPREFHAEEVERSERITTTVRFQSDRVDSRKVTRRGGRARSEVKERSFAFAPAYDLLSGLLYLRSLPLRVGDEPVVVMHPFTTAYLTRMKVLRRETIRTALGPRPAIKCEVKIGKIRRNLELKRYDRMKRGLVWISDDADRLPVEIRSEIFVGSVRASLMSRRPI